MNAGPIVALQGLTREFRGRSRPRGGPPLRAVDDMTWQIQPGEAVGYIGANGAASPRRSR